MKRINIFLTEKQIKFLKGRGSMSENIRYALETYIHKIESESISASQSKRGSDEL